VQVIAVTGSIGKTSTKEAIYAVLKQRFNVYSSKNSFNTEFGLSLAVLQEEESGFTSPIAWLKILRRVLFEKKEPYQKIVLEMGADKPGDIAKLMKIAPPKISVVTTVAPVHLAEGQFKNINEIAKEKGALVRNLPKGGVAVLNYDDARIREMETAAEKITYGVDSSAMLVAQDITVTTKRLKFSVTYKSQSQNFSVPVIGAFQAYVFLPAIAVGLKLGMALSECADALKDFQLPPGRMNPIPGIERTNIIDSSYNASPETMETALTLLGELKAERKIAALGMMNELGKMTHEAHVRIGSRAAHVADIIIAVGKEAPTYKKGAMDAGMKEEKIYTFFDSAEAGRFLRNELSGGDLVLVKGSQNRVRMEKLVKAIMRDPEKADALLCRQGQAWEKR